jgi:hypothetical protein
MACAWMLLGARDKLMVDERRTVPLARLAE